ncbi:MAG: 5-deoxy-glucuronate isomerase [Candidatus Auribacterota bacterium]|jgi:5-deoxy-glucuronate isomerase|nr:5-deoxy-glucuronate isomerase [Candidatus Auribacterota bacterium]
MQLSVYKTMKDGYTGFVDSRQSVLEKICLGYIREPAGSSRKICAMNGFEQVLVLLSGSCEIVFADGVRHKLGPRDDLFTQKAWAVYLPVGDSATLIASEGFEAVLSSVKADRVYSRVVITPDMVHGRSVGKGVYQRMVYDIAGSDFPAHRILIGETVNPEGNWSSFPPHKHDEARGDEEVKLEEAYYFRVKPAHGFGFQRIYSPKYSIDEAIVVKNHCVTLIPCGYHPVSASPGYTLYYLWILAGEARQMQPYDDPDHTWIKSR